MRLQNKYQTGKKTTSYKNCRLCPRECGVDRANGETGFCREGSTVRLAYAGLHKGEEPPISGEKGSGTLFFTGCTLQCPFCQNYQISRQQVGAPVTTDELAAIFLKLQEAGAANLNMVSGTHFIPGILNALETARRDGLTLPVVWNSSGYDTTRTLERLSPHVDIFLPDIKTLDNVLARNLFKTGDYPDVVREGLKYIAGQKKKIILRHLLLPGEVESTMEVLKWFRKLLYKKALLSLMFQYTPPGEMTGACVGFPILSRTVSNGEYYRIMEYIEKLGIEEGFIQELEPGEQIWSPDFRKTNPFLSEFSVAVWNQGEFIDPDR